MNGRFHLELQLANVEVMKQTRDAEIEKYKKYLNKAKTIIEGFGDKSKSSVDNSAEVGLCACMCLCYMCLIFLMHHKDAKS